MFVTYYYTYLQRFQAPVEGELQNTIGQNTTHPSPPKNSEYDTLNNAITHIFKL